MKWLDEVNSPLGTSSIGVRKAPPYFRLRSVFFFFFFTSPLLTANKWIHNAKRLDDCM